MNKDKYEISKNNYTGLPYDKTLKVLKEKNGKDEELIFHPSLKNNREIELDEPTSIGDLEEELSGP